MRWGRLFCLGAAVALLSASASAAPQACERALEPRDILIDIRESDVTVLIANLRDACTVVFTDWLHTGPGQAKAWPRDLLIWIEKLDGTVVSGMDGERHYYMAFEDTVGAAGWRVDYTLTRLPAGEIRIKKWTIEKMLHGLDHMRSAYGQGPLPWGTKVVMRVKVVLAVDDDLSNDDRTIQAETRDFSLRCPQRRSSDRAVTAMTRIIRRRTYRRACL